MIPIYEPLETSKCEKYGKVVAEPKELLEKSKLQKFFYSNKSDS